MEDLPTSGASIVFISHNLASVQKYCKRVIYSKQWQVVFDGDAKEATRLYNEELALYN